MDTTRLQMANQLLKHLGQDLDQYPLARVVIDLDSYYEVGSTLSSLGDAYKDSIQKAQTEVENTTKEKEYTEDIKKKMADFVTSKTLDALVKERAELIRSEVVTAVQTRINDAVSEAIAREKVLQQQPVIDAKPATPGN